MKIALSKSNSFEAVNLSHLKNCKLTSICFVEFKTTLRRYSDPLVCRVCRLDGYANNSLHVSCDGLKGFSTAQSAIYTASVRSYTSSDLCLYLHDLLHFGTNYCLVTLNKRSLLDLNKSQCM